MPRSAVSRADVALIAAAAAQGVKVSPYQLERWRTRGALPRNERRGRGRGRGSISQPPPHAVERVVTLGREAQQGRLNPLTDPMVLAISGDVPEETLRSALLEQLDRLRRRLRTDAGDDDEGFDVRYHAARSAARGARSFDIQELINACIDALDIDVLETRPVRPQATLRARTASLQLLSGGGEEVVAEDFSDILAGYGVPAEELDRQRLRDELTGQTWWDDAADAVNLKALQEAVRRAPGERLHRAVTAATLGPFLQWAVLLQVALNESSHLLLRELQEDPAWLVWGRTLSPPRTGHAGRAMTAFRAAGLCAVPEWFLLGVEQYVTRLREGAERIYGVSGPRLGLESS